jgi:mannosyl-3-phosphoglycerate phosphatase
MRTIIFSDLDGTLLDHHTYSFEAARPALELIQRLKIPIVLVSSKTRFELLDLREQLKTQDYPFVVENGSAIFTSPDYFDIPITPDIKDGLWCYRMGKTYLEIKTILDSISRAHNHPIRGFHNATIEEVAATTGLSDKALKNAMHREFTVPLFHDQKTEEILTKEVIKQGLQILYGGRFMHVVSNVGKGNALKLIMSAYRQKFQTDQIRSVAIGDSLNDFTMLAAADIGILVKRYDGTYESRDQRPDIILSREIGPAGWNISILELLKSGGLNE